MGIVAESRVTESREWIFLTGLFAFASFAEIFLFSNLAAFTPVYLLHIGFGDAEIKFWTGILASVGMLLGFWFVPMWGVLADRHGRKPLIVRSFAVEIVACVMMALAPNIWFFMLGRMLTGLALGNTGLMQVILLSAVAVFGAFAFLIVTGSAASGLGKRIGVSACGARGGLLRKWFDGPIVWSILNLRK